MKIPTSYGYFHIANGNMKVHVPVINLESATYCSSAVVCQFHLDNYKQSGFPLCYACNTERRFPNARKARIENKCTIQNAVNNSGITELAEIISAKIIKMCNCMNVNFMRINESGDLNKNNIDFVIALHKLLIGKGIQMYTYSKNKQCIAIARNEGIVVLESETDFVAVDSIEIAQQLGLTMCHGIGCGKTCLRCPKGLKTAVLKH